MEENKAIEDSSFEKCFGIILNGGKKDSRFAARKVRKLLYGSQGEKDSIEDIRKIIDCAAEKYSGITEDWRRENFVVAFSVIYFLRDKKNSPDFLFPWFFRLLQHQNGNIRYAAVRMISGELGPLTFHIRFPGEKREGLETGRFDDILYSLFMKLDELLLVTWDSRYQKYEYIDSLPASPYKSVQMVLAEMEDVCGKEYLNNIVRIQQEWEQKIENILGK